MLDENKFINQNNVLKESKGEYCTPRPLGIDLACFVKNKEVGENIIKMFDNVRAEYDDKKCFQCRLIYSENAPFWTQVKISYNTIGEKNAKVLSQLISENNIITEDKIKQARNIDWNFENMWKYVTSDKIKKSINLKYMELLFKDPQDFTQEEKDVFAYEIKNYKNQLALFEIYGMYLQVNKELENKNIERAASVVEHAIYNIDSKLYKDIDGAREFADQRTFNEHLHKSLVELLQVHRKYIKKDNSVKFFRP